MSRDLVSGVFWLAVAVFALVQGAALKLGTLRAPGPGFFPFWGGVLLAALSLVLLGDALRHRASEAVLSWARAPGFRKVLIVLVAILGYLLALEWLGFGAMTFLFVLLLFRLERKGWMASVLSAVLGSAAAYLMFQVWLKTQLPAGPWGF